MLAAMPSKAIVRPEVQVRQDDGGTGPLDRSEALHNDAIFVDPSIATARIMEYSPLLGTPP